MERIIRITGISLWDGLAADARGVRCSSADSDKLGPPVHPTPDESGLRSPRQFSGSGHDCPGPRELRWGSDIAATTHGNSNANVRAPP